MEKQFVIVVRETIDGDVEVLIALQMLIVRLKTNMISKSVIIDS